MARVPFAVSAAAALLLVSAAAWLAPPLEPAAEPEASVDVKEIPIAARGIAVRDEAAVYAPEDGETIVLASDGERVSAGGAVLAVSRARGGIWQALRDYAAGNKGAVLKAVRMAARAAAEGNPDLARPLAELYRSNTGEDYELVTAQESALWSEDADGLEYLSPETIDGLTVEGLEDMLSTDPAEDGAAAGKLVRSTAWYFAAFLPEGTDVHTGDRATLSFEGFTAKARAGSVSEPSGGKLAVVFVLTENMREALGLRVCDVEIVLEQ